VKAVRTFLVALSTLAGGAACDRFPTDVPQRTALSSPLVNSASSHAAPTAPLCAAPPSESATRPIGPEGGTIGIGSYCVEPTLRLQVSANHSNYAVAW
jgi:hypothetical protein